MLSDGLPLPQRRRAYLALGAATSMAVLDGTIANTALPTIARELHVSAAQSVWVINGFQVAVTMTLFAAAAFGQARGLSRTFRWGLAVFTVGSLACALASTFTALVLARVLQGLGSAVLMALGPALLRHIFPRAQLGRAVGGNAMVVATSLAAGPALGGAILAVAPWPWLFLINVPVGLGVVLLARGTLPKDAGHGGKLDAPSFLASAFGFGSLVYGLDGFARGAPPALALAEAALGVLAFGWFLRRQRQLPQPMFAVRLFRRPLFALASSTSFLGFIAWGLAVVTLPFLLQLQFGATPLQSGLLMTPWPLTMALLAPIAGRLSDRYPAGILSSIGLCVYAAGLALYALLPARPPVAAILGAGLVCGLGCGLYQTPNSRELIGSAPREDSGSASAILAAMRVGGQTVGAALVAVVFAAVAAPAQARVTLWLASAFAALAVGSSATRLRFPRARRPSAPAEAARTA